MRNIDSLLEAKDLVLKTAVEDTNIPFIGWIVLQLKMHGWNDEAAMNVPFLVTSDEIAQPIIGSNVIVEMLKDPEKYRIHPASLTTGFGKLSETRKMKE